MYRLSARPSGSILIQRVEKEDESSRLPLMPRAHLWLAYKVAQVINRCGGKA